MPIRYIITRRLCLTLCLALPWLAGCAAFRPMKGIPARYIPDDLKLGERSGKRMIDLWLLRQDKQDHQVDSGDVLGIYVGGIMGKTDENPPVQIPQNPDYQPAAGVPVTVREDGTISLPLVGAVTVRGMSMRQTEDAIREAYTNHEKYHEYLKEGQERILVSLQRPRQTIVLVVRQDSRTEPLANAAVGLLNLGTAKRGTGKVVSLPAYRNDVLNALIATDGLPGLDAENAVYIIRGNKNRSVRDPLWSAGIDPEELIRQHRSKSETVIRGQNPVGWANSYDSPANGGHVTQFAPQPLNPNFDARNWASTASGTANRVLQNPMGTSRDRVLTEHSPSGTNSFQPGIHPLDSSEAPQDGYHNTLQTQWNRGALSNSPAGPTPLSNVGQPARLQPFPTNQFPPQIGQPFGMTPGHSLPESHPFGMPGFGLTDPKTPAADDQLPMSDGRSIDIASADDHRIIRIPIRLSPGERVDIKKEDVILQDGDIVFIESRDTEVFFTGGLLGGGQYTLPRDRDLNILEAVSIATSRAGSAGAARQVGGVSALNSDVSISPSKVVVIRKLPEGGEVLIEVDILRARSDPSERIVIHPGDYLYLQFTPLEATAAFFERHLLEGALFGVASQQLNKKN